MAYTKAQLEALKNSLLAGGQPITASIHREFVQKIIDELYDAQSRGDLLSGVQATTSNVSGDVTLVIRSGQAYLIPTANLVAAGLNFDDLNGLVIIDPQNGDLLAYNSVTAEWENVPDVKVPYDGAVGNVDLGEFGLSAGYIKFDTSPTGTPTDQGTLKWNPNKSTLDLIMNGTIQQVGQNLFFYVKNSSGASIPKGRNVRFAGTDGASGHLLIAQFLANGTYPSSYYMGVTAEEIGNGEFGQVMFFGEMSGINTSSFSAGAILYASTSSAGAFQTTVPVIPNNIVEVAAAVNSKTNGEIVVRATIGYISVLTNQIAFGAGGNQLLGSNDFLFDPVTGRVRIKAGSDTGEQLQVGGSIYTTNNIRVNDTFGLINDAFNRIRFMSAHGWRYEAWTKHVFGGNVELENQIYSPVNAKGNSGTGTVTFNWNDGNQQSVTLTGNCTFAFSNPQSGASYFIYVTQDGTGGRTITWPTITWQGGATPTFPTAANGRVLVKISYDGSTYYGELVSFQSGGNFITDAPNDGLFYARKSQAWAKLHGLAADVTGGISPASPLYIDPIDGNYIKIYPTTGQVAIDGIKNGYEGREIFIWASTNYAQVVLNNNASAASASDRFDLSSATYTQFANFNPIHLIYIDSRWRVIN